ncbi:MAG: cyclophilin-like fold protein [Phocaeicola sp.]
MRSLLMLLMFASIYGCNPDKDEFITPPIPPIENPDGGDDDSDDEPENPPISTGKMKITIGPTEFTATLADNSTATAFKALLPLTLTMNDYGSNEKVTSVERLPTNQSNLGTIQVGDIMLWGSTSFVLFYDNFSTSYSYSRIGKIDNTAGLRELLNNRNSITIKFEIE